jgi:hypothetical protein
MRYGRISLTQEHYEIQYLRNILTARIVLKPPLSVTHRVLLRHMALEGFPFAL